MSIREFKSKYISGFKDYFLTFREYGISGLRLELLIRRSIWTLGGLKLYSPSRFNEPTSISDTPEYTDICALAAADPSILANFKRCFEYRLVLEHVTRSQGDKYLKYVRDYRTVISTLKEVSRLEIGDPITYPYPELGLLSPTQIRYAKILTDLIKLFPTLEGKDVLEIGVGNGGLAAQVSTHFKLNSYALVDLDDVLRLTSRTLKPFDHTVDFSFIAPSVEESRATDLLISNYAFSELHKQVQDIYFDKYVRHAKSGYMIYNHIHEDSSISYTANEMCERIPGAMILKELPLTYPGNVLLVWGISELAELKDFS